MFIFGDPGLVLKVINLYVEYRLSSGRILWKFADIETSLKAD